MKPLVLAAFSLALACNGIPAPAHAEDLAKKACYADAKRLCPSAVKAMSRKRAEECLAQKIDQTSPSCHAMIVRIKAQREAKTSRAV